MYPDTDDASLPDIRPQTRPAVLDRERWTVSRGEFSIAHVAPLVGMSALFVRRTTGKTSHVTAADVVALLDQDAFSETFVPRSKVLDHLAAQAAAPIREPSPGSIGADRSEPLVLVGETKATLPRLRDEIAQCIMTSPPYWAVRVYDDSTAVRWADGETCAFGHEQTPEAYVRHTVELLHLLRRPLRQDGSIWWNVMDTYNTRTRVRKNAAERVRSMRSGTDSVWAEHEVRRYSAGHSYLQDGELCVIPGAIAARASRIGYRVKSLVNWAKHHTAPDPQESRVGRGSEVILHLSLQRTPKFHKNAYKNLPLSVGGRDHQREPDRSSDTWTLPLPEMLCFVSGTPSRGCRGIAPSPSRINAACLTPKGGSACASPSMSEVLLPLSRLPHEMCDPQPQLCCGNQCSKESAQRSAQGAEQPVQTTT